MGGVSMEWKEDVLGNVLEVKYGKDHKKLADGQYPVYGSGGLMRYVDSKLYDGPSILIPRKGTLNNIMFVESPFWTVDTMFWSIINTDKVDPKFLFYSICKRDFASMNVGSAVPSMTVNILNDIQISYPKNIEDQRRIASILSSLDRKIELNNKINADLEEMAQAIFKNWFVDFEPFKDGKFVDSELEMIPEGWEVGSLGDFCNVFTGKKNTNQAIEKGLYPFFSCAPEPLASNDAIFNGKAIIIAGNGSYTGRTSFYNGGFDLYQRTYACTIREQDKENLMIFFYHMMKQFFEPVKMGGTRGSSIPYIVMGDITQQKFPYSEEWLIRFSNIVNSMMDRKLRIDKENSRLSTLRDTLLPRLMSGELEVPE